LASFFCTQSRAHTARRILTFTLSIFFLGTALSRHLRSCCAIMTSPAPAEGSKALYSGQLREGGIPGTWLEGNLLQMLFLLRSRFPVHSHISDDGQDGLPHKKLKTDASSRQPVMPGIACVHDSRDLPSEWQRIR